MPNRQGLLDYAIQGELSKDDAIEELRPYLPIFRDALTSAWARYFSREVSDDVRACLKKRTRANIVSDFVEQIVVREFDGHPVVRTCTGLGFLKLFVGERLVVRLKKLTCEFLPCNVDTDQQHDWYCDRPLTGISQLRTRLSIGYTLDDLELNIDRLMVVRHYGLKNVIWLHDFTDAAQPGDVGGTREAVAADQDVIVFTPRQAAILDAADPVEKEESPKE